MAATVPTRPALTKVKSELLTLTRGKIESLILAYSSLA
jgi:hypothetical protein